MPVYKVLYFHSRGRAEPIRMLLWLAGQEYVNKLFTGVQSEEWKKAKLNIPQGQLPVLEVDGKMIPQSGAIFRYLARKHGFYGENDDESTEVDIVQGTVDDFSKHLIQWFYAEESKKKEMKNDLLTNKLPEYFKLLEGILEKNQGGNGFFVGNKPTFADILVFDLNDQMGDALTKEVVQKAFRPKLAAFTTRMEGILKDYLATRAARPS